MAKSGKKYNIPINKKDILIDNKQNKVSFENKIDDWIPIITGKKFDKSDKEWESFLKLKKFRDDYDQHFKGFYCFEYENICIWWIFINAESLVCYLN